MQRLGMKKTFAALSILSVVLFAPLPGIVSLAIPDDDDSTPYLSLPNIPHLAKRAGDESSVHLDAAVAAHSLYLPNERETDRLALGKANVTVNRFYHATIRAPPFC